MKYFTAFKFLGIIALGILPFLSFSQDNVGIGTTTPHMNALLDLTSNSKGVLIPRLTTAERIAINPLASAEGLLVYDTDDSQFWFWDGTQWVQSVGTGSPGPTGPTGPAGTAGATGAIGPAGADGATGPAGVDGATGPAGADGATGPAGADGATGPVGADGATGPAGADGATGPAGADGATGPAGADGATGPAGADGATGPAGADGATGPAGADGATGPAGADGATGPAGADGATGPAGADGATGPAGADGATGPAGADGATGPAGADGATGPAGADGATGPAGADGATGPAGANGTNGVDGATGPPGPINQVVAGLQSYGVPYTVGTNGTWLPTGITTTVTTHGEPVFVSFSSNYYGWADIVGLSVRRDAALPEIAAGFQGSYEVGFTFTDWTFTVTGLDQTAPAGSHTYEVYMWVSDGTTNTFLWNNNLSVVEVNNQ